MSQRTGDWDQIADDESQWGEVVARGAAKPADRKEAVVSVRLSGDVLEAARSAASAHEQTLSAWARQVIQRALTPATSSEFVRVFDLAKVLEVAVAGVEPSSSARVRTLTTNEVAQPA